jgi:hypothetical protein
VIFYPVFLLQNSLRRQENTCPLIDQPEQETQIMQNQPILIIGKNAKTGLRVEQRLQALGYNTRGVSRSTSPAFDWEDPATWRTALEGTESAYVTFYPDLAIPTAEQTSPDVANKAPNAPRPCWRIVDSSGTWSAPAGSCRTSARAS